ncbi:hypothetical protein Ahy_A06g026842 isoform A [Arachis hypogaea]|uniref:Ataxin-2 C-terminal domain-containing protein n=1 Tax=Arachis hypogaea TaxID=3818 RepID=A0A445CLW9_ARAHY|nr:hypothetical protein Ahy_A06g026842 isoform A [Arachis hypogaea]
MALVSGGRSTLNPNAPLYIPAAFRQVEDFSPEWWQLVTTLTWYHEYWLSQQQVEGGFYAAEDDGFDQDGNDVVDLLPDIFDLDAGEDLSVMEAQLEEFIRLSEEETGHDICGTEDNSCIAKVPTFSPLSCKQGRKKESLVWLPIASEMALGNQKPGFSRDRARSRTNGSLKVTSTPSKVHSFMVASPLRQREYQPKPAMATSTLLTSQLVPDTLISISCHVPNSAACSLPMGG